MTLATAATDRTPSNLINPRINLLAHPRLCSDAGREREVVPC